MTDDTLLAELAMPDNCDGKEQEAFEAWAKSQDFDMHEHPLFYLFLDPKTNAARQAWNACIRYCRQQVKSSAALSKYEERQREATRRGVS